MHRHILDTKKPAPGPQRMMRYLGLDRSTRPSATVLYLQQRSRKGPMRPALKRYLQLDRGQTS